MVLELYLGQKPLNRFDLCGFPFLPTHGGRPLALEDDHDPARVDFPNAIFRECKTIGVPGVLAFYISSREFKSETDLQ